MRRASLSLLLLLLSGCVVTTSTVVPDAPPPPPVQVAEVWFGGQHAVPASIGGGWCYYDGPHVHDYFPEPLDWYAFDNGFFFWRGPVVFTYVGGHPMPGGGWCFIEVPHRHDYFPPYGGGFTWRGSGWMYGGPWSPSRPPPPAWWNYAPPRPPPAAAVRPPPPGAYRPPPQGLRVPVAPPRPMTSDHDQGKDHGKDHGKPPERDAAPPSRPPTATTPAKPAPACRPRRTPPRRRRSPSSRKLATSRTRTESKSRWTDSKVNWYTDAPMNPWLTALLLVSAGGFFAFTMLRRLAPLWAFRKDDRLDRPGERVRGLLRFGFGQSRLPTRGEVWPGLLHVLIFAAFVILGARTVTLFGMGFSPHFHLPFLGRGTPAGDAYSFVKDVAVLLALFASLAFIWRRVVTRPDRVTRSWEGVLILGFIAGLMLTDVLFEGAEQLAASLDASSSWAAPAGSIGAGLMAWLPAGAVAPVGAASFWLHLVIVLVFLNFLPFGKHFHVITALPDVYVQRLPPRGALRKLDLESETPDYGARSVKDLSWKEALDTYSCTECGRCQTYCPTYVTGKPLSHKEVNRTLRRHVQDQAPELVAIARAPDAEARDALSGKLPAVVETVLPEATIWACTTCGWCETACPVLIENVPRLVDLRRHQVLVESAFPEEAARVFKNIETQGNPWGIGSNRRAEWCEDLAIPRASEGDFEWLFFVGCAGAFDDRQKKVSRAIVKILRAAGVKFAILGDEETCNG
ncbi:MAG: (Fe-S)-binding protein, partial [Deltaproteobacteria bacterium]|nr:(Fe-S)-binding protein [Deltaproteobacteria bacterium]